MLVEFRLWNFHFKCHTTRTCKCVLMRLCFCVQFVASHFYMPKRKQKASKKEKNRFDTCKFNNGLKCWTTHIDIRLTHALSPSNSNRFTIDKGMCLFIYLLYSVSPEIFSLKSFPTFSCGICWWILKFFEDLTDRIMYGALQ